MPKASGSHACDNVRHRWPPVAYSADVGASVIGIPEMRAWTTIDEIASIQYDMNDRARAIWGNFRGVKDIGDAIQTVATFGRPRPL